MGHGEEEDTAFHMAAANRIEEGAGGQTRFAASSFPRRLLIRSASQEQTNPMQPWDKDGLAGGMVGALFDAGQAQGFTRADRAQSLGFETFRFFQHGGIPNQQPFLPSCFPLHNPLICS